MSPDLNPDDVRALEEGYKVKKQLDSNIIQTALMSELEKAMADPSLQKQVLNLAWLVKNGRLDVKIAVPLRDGTYIHGLYHEKLGYFQDEDGHIVAFAGSHNATAEALRLNYESMWVYTNWKEELYSKDALDISKKFHERWENRKQGLLVVSFPDAPKQWLHSNAPPELVDVVHPDDAWIVRIPPLREAQILGVNAWLAHESRGIIAMATGTGKTVVALAAVRPDLVQGRTIVVCVPTRALQLQWAREIRSSYPEARIIRIPGRDARWRKPGVLEAWCQGDAKRPSFVVGVTNTLVRPDVIARLKPTAVRTKFTLVADEVQHLGSRVRSGILGIEAQHRLGLSATPIREYDEEGTDSILAYFGGIVFEYPLARAVGRELCEYEYYVGEVFLTQNESDAYEKLSVRITKATQALAAACGGQTGISLPRLLSIGTRLGFEELCVALQMLMVKRADVSKKASNKIDFAVKQLEAHSKVKRILIYCDDLDQVGQLSKALKIAGIRHTIYEGSMNEKQRRAAEDAILDGTVRCVLSMKCLDEGIDFPAVDGALILASSKTPREFIQRRGRVLRRSPGKTHAVILDSLVVPPRMATGASSEYGFGLKALVADEARRAFLFAESARNKDIAQSTILRILSRYGVSAIEVAKS